MTQEQGERQAGSEAAVVDPNPSSEAGPDEQVGRTAKPGWVHTQAGIATIWVGLITGVLSLVAALLQFCSVNPLFDLTNGGLRAERRDSSFHNARNGGNLADDAVESGTGFESLRGISYVRAAFSPGFELDLPDCGGVIDPQESDWAGSPFVTLVWHGDPDSSVNDIVVRITEMADASADYFDNWLNAGVNGLRNDPANLPEGDLGSVECNGLVWHNLPMSRYNSVAGYQEAIDINFGHFGNLAIGVTFYFPVPPPPGVLEELIPRVLGSVAPAGSGEAALMPEGN